MNTAGTNQLYQIITQTHKLWKAMCSHLIGSDRKQRPQARRAFCHKLRAAIARLKVTGIGLSPRWNLQKGTWLACGTKKQNRVKHKTKKRIAFYSSLNIIITSLKASRNSPPGAMPSCSVIWAETLSRRICIRPDITPFCQTEHSNRDRFTFLVAENPNAAHILVWCVWHH